MVGVISGRFGLVATPIQTDADGRLIVRGEDQLLSFKDVLVATVNEPLIGGADGYVHIEVPDGEIWEVNNILLLDATGALTETQVMVIHEGVGVGFAGETRAIAVGERWFWHGHVWGRDISSFRGYFIGSGAGDNCFMQMSGRRMTLET